MMQDDPDRIARQRAIKQTSWAKQDKNNIDDAVKALLAHRNGRKLLWHLLGIGKAIGQTPYTGNALSTAFACGEQNVGHQLMALIVEVDAAGFAELLKEQYNENAEREFELSQLGAGRWDGDPDASD